MLFRSTSLLVSPLRLRPLSHFEIRLGSVLTRTSPPQRAIARHRLVNDALKDEFAAGLHALVIKAKSPSEYAAAGEA